MKKAGQLVVRCSLAAALLCMANGGSGLEVVMQQGQVVFNGRFAQQQVFWNGPVAFDSNAANSHLVDGFSLKDHGTDLSETAAGQAIAFMQNEDWLKAIEAIESMDSDDRRLVTDQRGILRPLSSLKSSLIASMPEAGQRTFRRLNDPAANTKLEQAHQLTDLPERERAYQSIVNDYALCDAAAEAANTLGDLRFEQGRFDEAAALFHFAAEHPASAPDDPMLMAKRLVALTRAERALQFKELAEYAAFRHGDTAVALGGDQVDLKTLIKQLAETQQQDNDARPVKRGNALPMPDFDRRAFHRPLIDEDMRARLQNIGASDRRGAIVEPFTQPIIAADRDRLYTLALGSVARLDPQTGTELWRTGDQNNHIQGLSGNVYQLAQGYHQALVATDQYVIAVVPNENYPNRSSMIAFDAETGKAKWDTSEGRGDLRNKSIIGEPVVLDNLVYAVVQQPNEAQVELVAITLDTGHVARSVQLGSASADPNLNAPAEMSPRLVMGQGYLLVQTNNGALIAVDPEDLSIAWAFTQKIRGSSLGMLRRRGAFTPGSLAAHTGTVVARDGLVFAKDTRSDQLHVFREFDATPVWSASTEADGTIVHVDHRHVYVMGGKVEEFDGLSSDNKYLVALDIRTGKPVWGSRYAGLDAGQPVFTDDACLIAGDQKLCRINLTTGKISDVNKELYEQADLAVIGNRLIHATSDSVSGYPLPDIDNKQP